MIRGIFPGVWPPILQCDKSKGSLFKCSNFSVPRNWFLSIKSLTEFTIKLFRHEERERERRVKKYRNSTKTLQTFLKISNFHLTY